MRFRYSAVNVAIVEYDKSLYVFACVTMCAWRQVSCFVFIARELDMDK